MSFVSRCGWCGKLQGPRSFGSITCDCTNDGRCGPHGNLGPCRLCFDEELERDRERALIRADLQSQEIY